MHETQRRGLNVNFTFPWLGCLGEGGCAEVGGRAKRTKPYPNSQIKCPLGRSVSCVRRREAAQHNQYCLFLCLCTILFVLSYSLSSTLMACRLAATHPEHIPHIHTYSWFWKFSSVLLHMICVISAARVCLFTSIQLYHSVILQTSNSYIDR